jgi:enterochelin esterase family protein
MERFGAFLAAIAFLAARLAHAQPTQPMPTTFPADTKPASTNIVGQQYPRVDSQRRVWFRINASEAQTIRVMGTSLAKGDDGFFTGTTRPQDPGFHYYQLEIDGVRVADPHSESFFGAGNVKSGIEIPEEGVDFYDAKNVPHGEIRARWYMAKSTNTMRQAFIYTPPDYDRNPNQRYPVLYLQHGMDEDRRAWPQQGRTNFIVDNLIAEGKAKPMIVVMEDGGIVQAAFGRGGFGGRGRPGASTAPTSAPTSRGAGGRGFGGGGPRGGFWDAFTRAIVTDVIPMVDENYRTIPDREHRAMAGLSLGGTQTYQITQANLDKFAYIGIFSAPFGFPGIENGYNGLLKNPEDFDKQVKVLFISMGSKEGPQTGRAPAQQLKDAGIKNVHYYEAPGTGHEFQTWRKSLHQFAPLLFRD